MHQSSCSRVSLQPITDLLFSHRGGLDWEDGLGLETVLFGLILLSVPFVPPIVSLARSSRVNSRVRELAEALTEQQRTINKPTRQMAELRQTVPRRGAAGPVPACSECGSVADPTWQPLSH